MLKRPTPVPAKPAFIGALLQRASAHPGLVMGGLGAAALGAGYLLDKSDKPKKLTDKTASVELISPMTLISMREEFDSIFEKEAEQVQYKVTKAGLVKSIKSKISR